MTGGTGAGAAPAGPTQASAFFITALGIGQICSWGSLYYSFPLIADAMGRELGWSKPELYTAATLGLALSGLTAYPVGVAIDRGHGRILMGGASVLAGLLLLGWSQVHSLALFYVLFAGIGALQSATLYEPAFAVVARRFGALEARRGITALTLWGGFASTVFVPLIQILVELYGWRAALEVLGLINLTLCAGLYLTAIRPSLDSSDALPLITAARPGGNGDIAQAFRSPIFWALAVAFTAFAATFSAFTFHFYPLLIERGYSATQAVTVIAFIGPAQVAGRIAIWVAAPNASVRRIGSIVIVALPLAMAAIGMFPLSLPEMVVVAVIYGAVNGIMTIVRGMAVPEMLTRRAYGAINGALTAPALIAKAAAPLGAALLWSVTQSYDAVLIALFAGGALTAAGFWTAAMLSRRSDAAGRDLNS